MRIALISDIHANLVALDAALADIAEQGVDEVVCLGDIADLGPQPSATVDRLIELGCPCILGNHDPFTEDFPGLEEPIVWSAAQLSAAQTTFLSGLPKSLTLELSPGCLLQCVHGSPRSYDEQLLAETPEAELEAWELEPDVRVVAAGHTHVQLVRNYSGRTFVNVGSVGHPFLRPFKGDGTPRCLKRIEYAIVAGDSRKGVTVELRSLPLDWDAFATSMMQSGFPQAEGWLKLWQDDDR